MLCAATILWVDPHRGSMQSTIQRERNRSIDNMLPRIVDMVENTALRDERVVQRVQRESREYDSTDGRFYPRKLAND